MIRNLKNIINRFFYIKKNEPEVLKEEICSTFTDIEVEIIWDDIINGVSDSPTECSIARALKREGAEATVTDYCIILKDGSEYYPEKFSDHWRAYMNSTKFKPRVITYKIV